MNISLQHLSHEMKAFILGQAIRMHLDMLSKCASFKKFCDEIDMVSLRYDVIKLDDVFMTWHLKATEFSQCGDLAAKKILGDFIINFFEINGFDGQLPVWGLQFVAQVDIACRSLSQEFIIEDGMFLADNSMRLHQYSISILLTVIYHLVESKPQKLFYFFTKQKSYNNNSINLFIYNFGNHIQNYWTMADLDLSQHQLNLSSSKQKYSFPRTKRFVETNRALCDSLYQLPNTFSKRGTTLGYGNKTLGNQNTTIVPGVGTYTFHSDINPEQNKQRSFTFGVSREKMESGGALGHVKFLQKIPAPGSYKPRDVADRRAPSMRSRQPDHDFQKFAKNPGPGAYQHENMGSKSYYLNSRYKNDTNVKISQVSRLAPISSKLPKVGPADYNPVDSLTGTGKYSLAKNQGINSCVFSRSQRQGLTEKTQSGFPGPGEYNSFSGFG